VAELLSNLPRDVQADLLEHMPRQQAADALEEMEEQEAERVLATMKPATAADMIAHMAPDDATDVLAEFPQAERQALLDRLPATARQRIQGLLRYPPDTAGGIMSPQVTALPDTLTAEEAIDRLRRLARESEQIYYTYVVDSTGRLVGVLSLRDLLLARDEQSVTQIMIRNVIYAPATMDREEVAALFSKYGYLALPVVDERRRLLGIVTVDDVVDVIQDEATEDMQRMVGAGADERVDSPVRLTLRRRVPWLLVNLVTALLAASVIALFEESLARVTALAILMGVVAGQAGNTGAQSMSVVIRAIATSQMRGRPLRTVMLREILIGLTAGAVVGLAGAAASAAWWCESPYAVPLAIAFGLSLWACMTLATVSGALVPIVMQRIGFDPAQASSIILTTVTDIAGFGVFLGLAVGIVLRHFP